MKKIFAVKDLATDCYGNPFAMNTSGEATRSFSNEVNSNNPNSGIATNPEDYILYELGEYDDDKGKITIHETPELIVRAKDVYKHKE